MALLKLWSHALMTRLKVLWSLLAVTAAAAALSGAVDSVSGDLADKALKRALVTFAVARTLNGVISVAQGTEVAVEPGGVGVVMTVGEILDPINDLIERFSGVMLVAASSIGLQILLLQISSSLAVTVLVVATALLALFAIWLPGLARSRYGPLILRLFLVMFFARFAIPLLAIGTNVVADVFLVGQQAEATAALQTTQSEIEEIERVSEQAPAEDRSWIDRIGDAIDESLQSINVTDRLDRLRDSASEASEHIITLIAVFVLETILLPLGLLWLLVELMKSVAARALAVRSGGGKPASA